MLTKRTALPGSTAVLATSLVAGQPPCADRIRVGLAGGVTIRGVRDNLDAPVPKLTPPASFSGRISSSKGVRVAALIEGPAHDPLPF